MTLARLSQRPGVRGRFQRAHIERLMTFLGMPRHKVYAVPGRPVRDPQKRQSFWQRNEGQLHHILYDINRCYLNGIKIHHPDRRGSEYHAASLSQAWQRVKKLFAQRGIKLST